MVHIDDISDKLNNMSSHLDEKAFNKMFEDIDAMNSKFMETIEKNSTLLVKQYKEYGPYYIFSDLLSRFSAVSDCSVLL